MVHITDSFYDKDNDNGGNRKEYATITNMEKFFFSLCTV